MSEGLWQYQSDHWRLVVIDGSELGPDLNGGRLVCINGTGDEPLHLLTIDPTKCDVPPVEVFGPIFPEVFVPTITPFAEVPAIPEPSVLPLLLLGLVGIVAWRTGRPRG